MDLIEAYIKRLQTLERAPLTLSFYSRLLKKAAVFIEENYGLTLTPKEADQIKGYMLDDLYQTLYASHSISTRNTYVTILQEFFKYLTDAGYLSQDPSRVLVKVRQKKSDDADPMSASRKLITPEKMAQMLSDDKGYNLIRDRAILETLDGTGLRCEEVTRLNVGTIRNRHPDGLIYVLRKGGKWKWVPISQRALRAIEAYLNTRPAETLKDEDPLFLSNCKNRLSKRSLYNVVALRQKRAGLPTGVHKFRYTVLNRVERASDPVVAMQIAGHSNLRTTHGYLLATPQELAKAINGGDAP